MDGAYIKDPKCKEANPFLFKPFQFDPEITVLVIHNQVLYWNVLLTFIGFKNVNKDGTYDSFVDILKSNPIGKGISSVEFLEYISQQVVFWVKSEGDKKQTRKNEKENDINEQHYDILEYKMMIDIITSELFKLMRDSYLESIGRRPLNSNEFGNVNYLEQKRLNSIH